MTDTSKREEFIAKAADAIRWASEGSGWNGMARAAFVVFEQAHSPTDDEREALFDIIDRAMHESWTDTDEYAYASVYIRDAILAAGFRRTVQGEPTGAQVLAEVREHAQRWADRPPTSPYAMGLRDAWRTIRGKIDRAAAEQVHVCDPTDSWFDRTECECGKMHYRCYECGAVVDECREGGGK